MKSINRPEPNIFVIAYLAMLGLGALLGTIIVFFLIIPAIQDLNVSVQEFRASVVVIAPLGVLSLLMAVVAFIAMIGLWQGNSRGRLLAKVLTVLLAGISILSVPVLLMVGLSGIALYVPLFTAVVLTVASIGALMALNQEGRILVEA